MSSIIEGYNYDIFISYRQKDNKGDQWVSEFFEALKTELESTFKEEICVYFDINPHDGLLETHDVDASLKEKLKCLIFIPIISRTYCDHKSFAWEHEFKAFVEMASMDQFGLKVKLLNGNVANRVLPVRIHDLDSEDIRECESVLGNVLRGIEFIYREPGVNKPLTPGLNVNKYSIQINKVANAVDEILTGLKYFQSSSPGEKVKVSDVIGMDQETTKTKGIWSLFRKKWLISGSAIVLMAIVTTVFFLVKKPISTDSYESITRPVTIINEAGKRETRRVLKENYITQISLFPFVNETNDTTTSWLQNGFPYGISVDLGQFNYISIGGLSGQYGTKSITHLQEQINFAKELNSTFFVTGSYKVYDGIYNVTSRIYQTSNGKIVSEREFKGNDFFCLIDSISLHARHDLNIPNTILDKFIDLPFKEQTTSELSAYQYYIAAMYNMWGGDENFIRAIELDSTFVLALYENAQIKFFSEVSESAGKNIDQAMRHSQRLSQNSEISVRSLYYRIHGEHDKADRLLEMQFELQPSVSILQKLWLNYILNFDIQKLESVSERLYEIQPGDITNQNQLVYSYLISGKYEKGLDLMKQVLKNAPDNTSALLQLAQLYLHTKEFEKAAKYYENAIYLKPELEKTWSWISGYIYFIQKNDIKPEFYKQFTGNYRPETFGQSYSFFLHNKLLVYRMVNQGVDYCYPVSESDFFGNGVKFTFIRNDRNNIIKTILSGAPEVRLPDGTNWKIELWKEDSLISKAKTLIGGNDKKAALEAFQNAWSQNPDHYYLQNFIQHLEFIQSDEYKSMNSKSSSFDGKYGNLTISRKNDAFYCTDNIGLILKLLPLTESSFMIPSIYSITYRFISSNDKITGIEVLKHDGEKKFYAKNN